MLFTHTYPSSETMLNCFPYGYYWYTWFSRLQKASVKSSGRIQKIKVWDQEPWLNGGMGAFLGMGHGLSRIA